MNDSNESSHYEVHGAAWLILLDDVIIHGKGLLLKLLSNVTQEIDVEVLEHFDVLQNLAIKQGSHLDFQILI